MFSTSVGQAWREKTCTIYGVHNSHKCRNKNLVTVFSVSGDPENDNDESHVELIGEGRGGAVLYLVLS